ncbi:GNAT family N-acetyltransferase [Methylobacillus sp.]|uniref:GNAT family N-acetyltransferase n=1 Tax=Methylobacillus sp. TaxID=56818 RepID=UPI002FE191FB
MNDAIVIHASTWQDDVLQHLLTQMTQELLQIYPDMPKPGPLHSPLVLIAFLDARAVGCVAMQALEDGCAEIKRLFVLPEARRQGVAKRLIQVLEQHALQQGYICMRVETGNKQSGAIALYQEMAYQPIAPFGVYIGNPVSYCFEKQLTGQQ